ncbi:hypothetical protein N0Q90_26115 (plasmid) [Sinorhizobium sp. M103]|nr:MULTISPECIES: hypothetical protein [unclassified Sinorhizobium]WEJ13743.1 hypothetical protein N0Q90_26115 [Sinorhizobium sp. M103]WEJ40113.1 hypothetical protein N0R80_20090 [Sinorhizobium sp. C101]
MVETQCFVYERGLEVRDDLDAHLAELFGGSFLRELANPLDGTEDLTAFLVDFLPRAVSSNFRLPRRTS